MPKMMYRGGTRTRPQVQTRAAFVPASVDDAARTVDIIWTTGAEGERCEWDGEVYLESLRVDDASVRMGRLNAGAPVLNSHQSYELSNQIGVVERAWIENGVGHATIKFSSRAEVEPFWLDVKNGVIRNISVGYVVYRYEVIEATADGEPKRMVAVDWEPMELSFVPVPFDAGAQVRGGASPRTFTAEVINRTKGSAPMKGKIRKLLARRLELRAALAKAREMTDESAVVEAQNALEAVETELSAALDTLEDGVGDAPAADPVEPAVPAEASGDDEAVQRGIQAERARHTAIRSLGETFPAIEPSVLDGLIARGLTFNQAQMAVLTQLAQRQAPISNIHNGERDTTATRTLEAMGQALLHRAAPRRAGALTGEAARFRGDNLIDMGRRCIEMAGGRSDGLSRREIAQLSLNIGSTGLRRTAGMHSTSDFPLILGNTIDRTLRAAYAETEPTWMQIGRRDDVNDFRQRTIVALGDTAAFEKVLEGGEYKYGTMPEEGNTYKVDKYGKIIPFTWEAMINDDLGAFDRLPSALAQGARQTESNLVWGLLLSNPNWIDGQPIYSAAHGNLAATGTAITIASLGAARAAMRKQKGINGQNFINIVPKYLVVGPDRELEAQQFLSPNYLAATNSNINPFAGTLTLIVEPRITDGSWYVIGDGADTFVYCYLTGEDGLFTETREGFEVDGVEVKGRLVFGTAFVDYRSLYKNPGA